MVFFSGIIVCGNRNIANILISDEDGAAQNYAQVVFSVEEHIIVFFKFGYVFPASNLILSS